MPLNVKYHQYINMLITFFVSLSLSLSSSLSLSLCISLSLFLEELSRSFQIHITKCLLIYTQISNRHPSFTRPIPYSRFFSPSLLFHEFCSSNDCGNSIVLIPQAKTFSAFFDCSFSLTLHIQSINQSYCFYHKIILQNLVTSHHFQPTTLIQATIILSPAITLQMISLFTCWWPNPLLGISLQPIQQTIQYHSVKI